MGSEDPDRLLSEIERQQVELYVGATDDSLPPWYFPMLGVGSGLPIASLDLNIAWVTIVLGLVAAFVVGGSVGLMQRRAGFSPRLSALPGRLRRWVYGYMIGATALLLAVYAYAFWLAAGSLRFTIAGVVTALVVWVSGVMFQRRYRRMARQIARAEGIVNE